MTADNKMPWAIIGGAQTGASYYPSRSAARVANKAIGGKISANKLADPIETADAIVVESEAAAEAELAEAHAAIDKATAAPNPFERLGAREELTPLTTKLVEFASPPKCPVCGSLDLFSGVGSDAGIVIDEEFITGCHNCGHVVDSRLSEAKEKAAAKKAPAARREFSTAIKPTKLVWHIADDLKGDGPIPARKDIMAACLDAGIAFYTARTQTQLWLACQKSMGAK